ncbi:MAG: hypothetical protein Ct9H300mP15_08670 [Gemmatimonadota bacterium]|nr:MAG: hypothetical protein Ct9H300mP15_08670 [Gemmatimonadota bacterium]
METATQMIELAKSIQDATSASDAAGMVRRLARLGMALTAGQGEGWQGGGLWALPNNTSGSLRVGRNSRTKLELALLS